VSQAVESPPGSGQWQRTFANGKGHTIAKFDTNTNQGTIAWAGEPLPLLA